MPRHVFTWNVEGYVQDSWRLHRRLTIDVGVRWRHLGLSSEDTNAMSGFYPQLWKPAAAPRLYWPAVVGGKSVALDKATGATTFPVLVNTVVPGSGDVVNGMHVNGLTGTGDFYTQPFLVFAPRFGFAWDVFGDGRTAVRGSGGIFHNMHSSGKLDGQYGSPPVLYTPVIYYSTFGQVQQAAASAAMGATSATMSTGDHKVEASYQTNFTIQREIGFNTVVDLGYVGNFTRHGFVGPGSAATMDINYIPLHAYADPANIVNGRAVPANLLRNRYPGMGSIMMLSQSLSTLNYHALQMGAERRLSHGLQFGASYTFSKALGIQGWDPYHDQRGWWYGPLTGNNGSDRRHNFAIYYTYFLPGVASRFGALKHVLNDWVLSGITMFQTGAPLTPSCSSTDSGIANSDPSLSGGGARCLQIADPQDFQHDFNRNFNTSAFTLASPATFGNIGLGILRSPAWSNWDVTLEKRIRLGGNEQRALRLRIEAYNVFNHAQFNNIGTSLSLRGGVNTSTTYGQYTGTRPPRQMSTTLRFEF